MRPSLLPPLCLTVCSCAMAMAGEAAEHRFDTQGAHYADGLPDHAPKIYALAEKPITLRFSGMPAGWQPAVQIQRVTSARSVELQPTDAVSTDEGWSVIWTPPETRDPAHYLILLKGDPERRVRIESRDSEWFRATREMLAAATWRAQGLTAEELTALDALGIQTGRASSSGRGPHASLEMRMQQGDASRRRIVWDSENTALLVWRAGPALGDLEARAPRWWISPEALASDHGIIRFLDLFSEPPLNP